MTLNRKVVWGDRIITYEADGRNVEFILNSMGLGAKSKGLDAPIVAETPREAAIEEVELGPVEAKEFRRIAALANHAAMEWPDIQASCARKCLSQAHQEELGEAQTGRPVPQEVPSPPV